LEDNDHGWSENQEAAMTIAGYQIQEKIYESENSLVYRGRRETEEQSVVFKMLKQPYPPPEKIAWFKREYELTHNLQLEGVIKAYSLTTDQHRPVIVLEDFGGESLELHLKKRQRRFSTAEFLPLAIQIADILGHVHHQHIMHKDVNPSNIVWNPKTGQVKLIDFGISTRLTRENPVLRNPAVGEGTLAYISPEQTGRMNRAMDYRTDLYSLGVSFYELLTGQLPFPTVDALELMHAHIAKQPVPPSEIAPDVPGSLSAIVLKLMAKNAEDRYQSTGGLKTDLQECLRQWRATGKIDPFPLGRQDVTDRFHIPQKLYGRETEIDTLLEAFARVSQGAGEMMLVSGYAGVGKSALVREMYKPITRQRGYFTTSKFEQLHKNVPYASLAQAFRSLIRQLLTENEDQVAAWRKKLLGALGPNCQIITEIIPEIALIVGPQPSAAVLPPAEAQNRFNLVFQNFIRVFTCAEHPLVLFLDDLQWADPASLNLVRLLMTAPSNRYLFVVGAYRDNEVHTTHSLMLTLDEIRKTGSVVNHVVLQPLGLFHICQLIADTLNCSQERVRPLAELVFAKTNGNPFFVSEFLKSLYTEALLTFDFSNSAWRWDIAKIQARNITANVVELMGDKLQKLREQTQQTLKMAACIGHQFNLRTLAVVSERSPKETAADLWEALEKGLIFPFGDTYKLISLDVQGLAEEVTVDYKFAHDRIQQAAYASIPEAEKKILHRRIGQLLLQKTSSEEYERQIFDIVNHLNLGSDDFDSQDERDRLAELNLLAGKKAKAAVAYAPALKYFQIGVGLLGEEGWDRQYDLTLSLYVEATEAAYLSGDYACMEQVAEVVLQRAKVLEDKIKVYECKIEAGYTRQHKIMEGIKVGLQVLELLGRPLPERPTQTDIARSLQETQRLLAGRDIGELLSLPEMTDPRMLAVAKILMRLFSPAYVGNPELFLLIVCHMVRLSLEYGNTPLSALAYAAYGFILVSKAEDIDKGYEFGRLALNLVERLHARDIQASVLYMVNGFVRFWKDHVKDTLDPSLEAYKIALETGAVEFAALSAFSYNFKSYWSGKNLAELESDLTRYGAIIEQLKQETVANLHRLHHQAVLNLMGQAENPYRLVGRSYDEDVRLPLLLEAQNNNALCFFYINKLVLCYLFQNFSRAVEYADKAETHLRGVAIVVPVYYLYRSLAQLAMFPTAPVFEQERILARVAANQEKMKLWAQHAPMNYLHKFYLVEAERARISSNEGEAREFYDKAITLAQEHEYLNEEALAYELAGRFYFARGQRHLARYYLHDAHYAYLRWGALAKVHDLEKNYPQFFATRAALDVPQPVTNTSTASTEHHMSTALDARSVFKASQAIASEIVLDRLLNTLMKIVIENAGAQRGFLILEQDGQLVIEAEGAVDRDEVLVLQSVPAETRNDLPISLIRYVERTNEQIVLSDAAQEAVFATDPYVTAAQPKSILCAPLVKQGKFTGVLYLENNLVTGAFTPQRLEVLNLLSAEAAISIDNARLYRSLEAANGRLADYSRNLEQKVAERTQALQEKNQELEIANQQVQEASQRKSQFLAGMSHELRTPMNAILGFTRLVLRRAGDLLPERQRNNLEKVKESADHLLGLINQLLDLSRLEAGRMELHPEPFDVRRFILGCCEMVSPLIKPGVYLKREIADVIGEAYTDEEGLRHVVINLLSNAIKFTDAGEVLVRARVEGQANGDVMLVITVADTGVGIPADALETIFEEFQQVEGGIQKREGTGLGLPIAKKWVELLGGSIAVESELGKGSTFTVSIPVVYQG
jgi:predicted ATPase/signal transduction histidine kinase